MKYLIHTQYCWYDTTDGEKIVCMYFIQNVPFTFDELPEVAKDDVEIFSLANGQKRWNEEDLYRAYSYLMEEECNPMLFELELENPELVPID